MTSRPKNDLLQRKVFLWTFMSPTFFSIIWIIFSNFVEVAVNYELEMSYFYWVTLRLKNDLFQRKVSIKIKLYLHFFEWIFWAILYTLCVKLLFFLDMMWPLFSLSDLEAKKWPFTKKSIYKNYHFSNVFSVLFE